MGPLHASTVLVESLGHDRVALAHLPTALEPMDRLGSVLGIEAGRLKVKRDDATGLALGGNKVRKLEFLCAQALAVGADWLVTAGGPQSNHARMTAAAAARLGLGCTLLLDGDPPSELSGNLLLDDLFGADIQWTGTHAPRADLDELLPEVANALSQQGRRPHIVAVGGSVPVGALGYVLAADELREEVPDLAAVFVATGSAGTHAGLAAGLGDHGLVRGIRVGERPLLRERVAQIARASAELAGRRTPIGSVQLDDDQLGDGYGAHTRSAAEAMGLAARMEGLILDPVYTGKAMAGLIAAARDGRLPPEGSIVFVHTGGAPGLMSSGHAEWRTDHP